MNNIILHPEKEAMHSVQNCRYQTQFRKSYSVACCQTFQFYDTQESSIFCSLFSVYVFHIHIFHIQAYVLSAIPTGLKLVHQIHPSVIHWKVRFSTRNCKGPELYQNCLEEKYELDRPKHVATL